MKNPKRSTPAATTPFTCVVHLVESDVSLRESLSAYLAREGLTVVAMANADELALAIRSRRPDLVVLDAELPGLSALQVCQTYGTQASAGSVDEPLPIILRSSRVNDIDQVLGLELGADDYVGKALSPRALLARIRAVLRRARPSGSGTRQASTQHGVALGNAVFIDASRSLHHRQGVRVLSPIEHGLLKVLTAQPGRLWSRQQLIAASQGAGSTVAPRAVDAAVMRLRRLVEPQPESPRYIQTVRGQGYMYVPEITTP